jgi:hypothetical protein
MEPTLEAEMTSVDLREAVMTVLLCIGFLCQRTDRWIADNA